MSQEKYSAEDVKRREEEKRLHGDAHSIDPSIMAVPPDPGRSADEPEDQSAPQTEWASFAPESSPSAMEPAEGKREVADDIEQERREAYSPSAREEPRR